MAKYSYTYSGEQAAFILSGICVLPAGVAVELEGSDHEALANNKFVKHLVDHGELSITEIEGDSVLTDPENTEESLTDTLGIKEVRAALKDLGVAFTTKETLEQLQAKLAQVTE